MRNVPANAQALLDLDKDGALVPHGIGGHARTIITEFISEHGRLTARIAELEKALTWQPIDTAPKDGTWIMGWASGDLNPSRISWGRNHRNNLSWCTAFCSFVEGYITHWTPLPRTTLEASERGGGE